jgi:hypothetical protein
MTYYKLINKEKEGVRTGATVTILMSSILMLIRIMGIALIIIIKGIHE